jgi:hypothetical protein
LPGVALGVLDQNDTRSYIEGCDHSGGLVDRKNLFITICYDVNRTGAERYIVNISQVERT